MVPWGMCVSWKGWKGFLSASGWDVDERMELYRLNPTQEHMPSLVVSETVSVAFKSTQRHEAWPHPKALVTVA